MRFVDTNVLLYAASLVPEEADKRNRARVLLTEPELAVSVQVLQEFYHQATRPTRIGRLSHEDAIRFLEPILLMRVQAITVDLFRSGVAVSQRFGLSYWDGAIVAAARAAGCEVVYSEDMSAGQDYEGLRVINPFVGL
jgi:predicted nucleic acid-binding protein